MSIDKVTNTELISWQEIINLPSDLQIIIKDNEQPIISKKTIYYRNIEMTKKIIGPVAI